MQDVFIGVDVSKDTLDIAGSPGKAQLCIANGARDIGRWLKGLPPNACVAMESTGRYHQRLAELARDAGLRVYVLNPKRVRTLLAAMADVARLTGSTRRS